MTKATWDLIEKIRETREKNGDCLWYFNLSDQATDNQWVAEFIHRGERRRSFKAESADVNEAVRLAAARAQEDNDGET